MPRVTAFGKRFSSVSFSLLIDGKTRENSVCQVPQLRAAGDDRRGGLGRAQGRLVRRGEQEEGRGRQSLREWTASRETAFSLARARTRAAFSPALFRFLFFFFSNDSRPTRAVSLPSDTRYVSAQSGASAMSLWAATYSEVKLSEKTENMEAQVALASNDTSSIPSVSARVVETSLEGSDDRECAEESHGSRSNSRSLATRMLETTESQRRKHESIRSQSCSRRGRRSQTSRPRAAARASRRQRPAAR